MGGKLAGAHVADASARLPIYVLLAIALFPPTFFMRMTYSESTFLFLTVLAMYAMKRNWRWWLIATIVGLSTATRFVGLALLPPLVGYVWQCSRHGPPCSHDRCADSTGTWRMPATLARAAASIVIGLSGLLAYMDYQWLAFSNALAFIDTQDSWRHRVPQDLYDKMLSLVSCEPIWLGYVPGSAGYVRLMNDPAPVLLSLQFANPVLFVGAVALVVVGAFKRWLSWPEVWLSAGLILIPYAGRAFEMCMASQGRFVAAAFPIYLVLGNILIRVPRPWATAILALFGICLGIYSAMLAAGFVLI
jgi:phosphoglycerol transferase MdoB-like AlkP superfamily enzyme